MSSVPPDPIALQQLQTQIDNLKILLEEATLRAVPARVKQLLDQIKATEQQLRDCQNGLRVNP